MKISSSSSPRISVSRSSLSLQDDFYDSDNSCPFALIDYDIPDLRNRSESFDGKGLLSETPNSGLIFPVRKSHDAAVGALVHLLSTAPPLRQDSSNCIKPSQVSRVEPWGERMRVNATPPDLQTPISDPGTTASGLLTAKTASVSAGVQVPRRMVAGIFAGQLVRALVVVLLMVRVLEGQITALVLGTDGEAALKAAAAAEAAAAAAMLAEVMEAVVVASDLVDLASMALVEAVGDLGAVAVLDLEEVLVVTSAGILIRVGGVEIRAGVVVDE